MVVRLEIYLCYVHHWSFCF